MAFLDPNCLDLGQPGSFNFRHHMTAQNPFSLIAGQQQQQQQQHQHHQEQLQQQVAAQRQQQQPQQQLQQPQPTLRNMAGGKKVSDVLDSVQSMDAFPYTSQMYYPRYAAPASAAAASAAAAAAAATKRLHCSFEGQYMPWGAAAGDGTADKAAAAAYEAQRKALTMVPDVISSTKYAYKPAGLQELYMWYITRQQLHLYNHGHRAIVENLVIYLEGLKVIYRDADISLSERSNYGHRIIEGGPLPHQAFRDNLVIETNTQPSKTCNFIIDSVVNFLHTGTLGSLCMMETISSYFIPIRNGEGLSSGDVCKTSAAGLLGKVGYKKLIGGYKPGECGSLNINSDGTFTLKSYGILLVIGMDFVAASVKPVFIERLTTSSIRLLHPSGTYSLPKHVLRYKNRPIGPELTLPAELYPGTNVAISKVHC